MADDQFRERFTLAEQLGVGGMGEVYKGVHKSLNRPVAIKFLATDLLREPLYRERFTAEAQLASQLIHSNVVAVFDFGIAAGVPYLVTEFVRGQTLSSMMKAKPEFDPQTTIELACQLLDGLSAIHRIGIVHRDIKPENLLVIEGPPRILKIADFGIAKGQIGSGGPQTAAGLMLGTPAYMSPEQVLGDQIKPASDLYACGIIIYQLILGTHPFQGDDAFDVVRRQLHEDPVIPKDLYKAVQTFLQRALAKRSAERFESADEMKKAMQGFAEMVIAGGTWRREHATLPPQGPGAAAPNPDVAKWQLGESGVRKASEMGVTRIRAAQKAQAAAQQGSAPLTPVPGGLATPAAVTEVGLASGSGVRPKMRPVAADRPATKARGNGLTYALVFLLACASGVALFLKKPELFRGLIPKPVASTALETPPSVAAPVFSLRWANPVKTLLSKKSAEAAAVIFRHAQLEAGLSDMRFVDPVAIEVDQLLVDALDQLPRELDAHAVGVDKGPPQRLCEIVASFKGPLGPDNAKRYLAALEALDREQKSLKRLPQGNVLHRLAAAFRLVGASSNGEVTRELQYLLLAARSSPMVPLSGWCARLADAVIGPLTPAGGSLADLASRKSLAAAETKERPNLEAVLTWLEDELRATGNRIAATPNPRCEARKRWLINEIMLRAETQARKRSHPDTWAVPASLAVERFHEIEGYPGDMLSRLDSTLTREGSINPDSALTLDVTLLCDLARTLGCPPNLIKRVEEDELGCL